MAHSTESRPAAPCSLKSYWSTAAEQKEVVVALLMIDLADLTKGFVLV